MKYEADIVYEGNCVVVSTRGTADYKGTFDLWSKIVEVCESHDCYRILGISGSEPMTTITAYDHEKIFTKLGFAKKYRVAWFVKDAAAREKIEYLAAVLRNRNLLNGFVFEDYGKAKEWLQNTQ